MAGAIVLLVLASCGLARQAVALPPGCQFIDRVETRPYLDNGKEVGQERRMCRRVINCKDTANNTDPDDHGVCNDWHRGA